MDTMAAIKQTFFQECEEQLAELESGLLALESGEADAEMVNAIFRAVHSIKGGAGAFHLDDLVHFSHAFETTLDRLRSRQLEVTPVSTKVMLRSADMLADLVRVARDGGEIDQQRRIGLIDELNALIGQAPKAAATEGSPATPADDDIEGLDFQPLAVSLDDLMSFDNQLPPLEAAGSAQSSFTIRFTPKPELYAKANEAALLLRELGKLGETIVTCDTSTLPKLSELDPEGAYLTWTVALTTAQDRSAVQEIFEFVELDCDLEIVEGGTAPAGQHAGPPDLNPAVENSAPQDLDVAALLRRLTLEVQGEAGAAAVEGSGSEPTASLTHPDPTDAAQGASAPAQRGDTAKAEAKLNAAAAPTTIRVDVDRVDRLVDLIGELVINQAMLTERVAEAGLARASTVAVGLDELERLTREIQDSVMAIRAQPVKPVFQRMHRIAREVSDLTGKPVNLVMVGEATEVDKTVIECLADPLTHMIRNAIDHGIESPEKRAVSGKPAEGTVQLSALHRSGRIVIEVADDGAGIDRPRVKAIAISKGLIPADSVLSDEEIDNLLFLPGFSTVEKVSNLSGRGVGMDVVKRSIQALGGRISISSRQGQGSTFTMSLPLTLAVLDGMVVSVAGQTLVLPLTTVIETLQPKEATVHGFGSTSQVISVRNAFTPLIDVGQQLGYRAEPADPLACVAILVESEDLRRCALLVDTIQDQRQIVVKSLEGNYGIVPGIAAATILGDGRVALILDVDAVIAGAGAKPGALKSSIAA